MKKYKKKRKNIGREGRLGKTSDSLPEPEQPQTPCNIVSDPLLLRLGYLNQ